MWRNTNDSWGKKPDVNQDKDSTLPPNICYSKDRKLIHGLELPPRKMMALGKRSSKCVKPSGELSLLSTPFPGSLTDMTITTGLKPTTETAPPKPLQSWASVAAKNVETEGEVQDRKAPKAFTQPTPTPAPQTTSTIDSRFAPSYLVRGERPPIDQGRVERASALGIYNANYRGDIPEYRIKNPITAKHPDNCCLWITKIPAQAELRDIFAAIDTGAVAAYSRNPPEKKNTAAGSLAFKTRAAAEKFFESSRSVTGIRIMGRRVHVCWNRNGRPPFTEEEAHQTRVISIEGPRLENTVEATLKIFKGESDEPLFDYQLVEDTEFRVVGLQSMVKLYFSSIRGQSRTAFKRLREHQIAEGVADKFKITYSADPCSPSETPAREWKLEEVAEPVN